MDCPAGVRRLDRVVCPQTHETATAASLVFKGGDVFNLGAANATDNRDFVTLGVGFRYRALESLDLGFAYELPLTDDKDGLMQDRFTLDAVWRF